MQKKLINIFLIVAAVAVVFIMVRDFTSNKAGKNIENEYKYDINDFIKVDSSLIMYEEIDSFKLDAEDMKGMTLCNDLLYLVSKDSFWKYDKKGNLILGKKLNGNPTCITCLTNGEFLIGMRDHVRKYDGDGNLIARWNSYGDDAVITSIAVGNKFIYIADAGNRIVYKCNYDGVLISKIGQEDKHLGIPGYVIPSAYFDIAVDTDDFLWAVNPGLHSLENYNEDGSLRSSWKASSLRIEGFSGCCNPAHFAIMNDNSFVTSEKGLVRVKIYDQHGQFKGVVAPPASFDMDAMIAPEPVVDGENRIILLDFETSTVRTFQLK